eukprot:m.276722 g.276722  ORF g.276722 m.276722 type:complete len:116 (+) comp40605_c0_seq92:2246-2593(+)
MKRKSKKEGGEMNEEEEDTDRPIAGTQEDVAQGRLIRDIIPLSGETGMGAEIGKWTEVEIRIGIGTLVGAEAEVQDGGEDQDQETDRKKEISTLSLLFVIEMLCSSVLTFWSRAC